MTHSSSTNTIERKGEYTLIELIPHRPPAILLDEILHVDSNSVLAGVNIQEQSSYYSTERGGVPVWIGLEYMAQTVSMWSGYQQRRAGRPIKIGFLLGCKQYHCETAVFKLGTALSIEAAPCYVDDSSGLSSFNCIIRERNGRLASSEGLGPVLAEARINAIEPEDPHALIT